MVTQFKIILIPELTRLLIAKSGILDFEIQNRAPDTGIPLKSRIRGLVGTGIHRGIQDCLCMTLHEVMQLGPIINPATSVTIHEN